MPETANSGPSRDASPPGFVRRFRMLPRNRQFLLIEAVFWLAFARIALTAVQFRHLASRFGAVHKPGDAAPKPLTSAGETELAQEVGWAVTRAARYVPFRAVCLPQAIAAKAMLDRRRVASVMHFGVATKTDGPLEAHAWLDAGPVEVTGYPVQPAFVEVAYFL